MVVERRDSVILTSNWNNQKWEDCMIEGKTCQISQKEVLEAYKAVKANKGSGGVDDVGFEEFERDLKNRL